MYSTMFHQMIVLANGSASFTGDVYNIKEHKSGFHGWLLCCGKYKPVNYSPAGFWVLRG